MKFDPTELHRRNDHRSQGFGSEVGIGHVTWAEANMIRQCLFWYELATKSVGDRGKITVSSQQFHRSPAQAQEELRLSYRAILAK